MKNGLSTD